MARRFVAAEVQEFCEAQGWTFFFIGGLVTQAWAEARVTKDADLTLITGCGEEEPFVDALLARFPARTPDAREHALRHRVLLLQSKSGLGLDIGLGGMDFECRAAERSVLHEFLPGLKLRICTAEDLIVLKVFAARAKDWGDVEMTIVRQGDAALDRTYIREQLIPLLELKEQPGLLDELEALRAKLRPRP
jgi:hypothetical protein